MLFPVSISALTLAGLVAMLAVQWRTAGPSTVFHDLDHDPRESTKSNLHYLVWIGGMLVGTALIGFPLALTAFVFVFTMVKAGGGVLRNGFLALGGLGFLGVMAYFLVLKYPAGLLQEFVGLPWWLGG